MSPKVQNVSKIKKTNFKLTFQKLHRNALHHLYFHINPREGIQICIEIMKTYNWNEIYSDWKSTRLFISTRIGYNSIEHFRLDFLHKCPTYIIVTLFTLQSIELNISQIPFIFLISSFSSYSYSVSI